MSGGVSHFQLLSLQPSSVATLRLLMPQLSLFAILQAMKAGGVITLSHKPDSTNPSADCLQCHTQGRKGVVTW